MQEAATKRSDIVQKAGIVLIILGIVALALSIT